MLKKIIELWKGQSFMNQVVEEFGEMLSDAEFVYNNAWGSVIGRVVIDEIRQPLYDRDKAVNKREREIRRMLVEHLTINPKEDTGACLVMMSLVKDAERIGDYSKNIFELATILRMDLKEMKYYKRLSALQKKLSKHLPLLKRAFLESDETIAQKILRNYQPIKSECNDILSDLFSEELPTQESVTTVLLSRYFKRINSHMSNIASGIVYSLDKIDFVQTNGGILE
jgi:phosphate uptake regulator